MRLLKILAYVIFIFFAHPRAFTNVPQPRIRPQNPPVNYAQRVFWKMPVLTICHTFEIVFYLKNILLDWTLR